ncbi:unnamed protein product [Cyprideis torosa]|uniref:Uncharacterized protein n=1 Tax=Cyprideis torosa TaxID=163714 RepID=A0A7R8WIH4_9CRUS|nr:unnamed protein product [Cyprideis torosa]CAG0900770.1 unnamed protein product [Cyprideis torosa]
MARSLVSLLAVLLCLSVSFGVELPQEVTGAPGAQVMRAPETKTPGDACGCAGDASPVCGTDGKTYRTECELDCHNLNKHDLRRCRITESGKFYKGEKAETRSGKACTSWRKHKDVYGPRNNPIVDENFPDGSVREAKNYCRNPDQGTSGLWCFTGNGEKFNYDTCDVPMCLNDLSRCRVTREGKYYVGTQRYTRSGKPCTHWHANSHINSYIRDYNFPRKSVRRARNYCRNPDSGSSGLWCYTGIGEKFNYDQCRIPWCRNQVFEASSAEVFEACNSEVFEGSDSEVFEGSNSEVFEAPSAEVFEGSNSETVLFYRVVRMRHPGECRGGRGGGGRGGRRG